MSFLCHGSVVKLETNTRARPTPSMKDKLIQWHYLPQGQAKLRSDPQPPHLFLRPHAIRNRTVCEQHYFRAIRLTIPPHPDDYVVSERTRFRSVLRSPNLSDDNVNLSAPTNVKKWNREPTASPLESIVGSLSAILEHCNV